MKKTDEQLIEKSFSNTNVSFQDLILSIINNKIDELVNNANKVNTATSQNDDKEHDAS